jgi:hypothetical protein
MDFSPREEIMNQFVYSIENLLNTFDLDDIGIYEEEGEGKHYYMGYTIRKDGKVYMINQPYIKDEQKNLAVQHNEWTIQTEKGKEIKGFSNLETAFQHIDKKDLH